MDCQTLITTVNRCHSYEKGWNKESLGKVASIYLYCYPFCDNNECVVWMNCYNAATYRNNHNTKCDDIANVRC